ncbi:hypothetical protein [Pontibacter burrus]|uniref:Uncharacterized protein n=1 Tax=Pontibacter burrus TaxID=2704466 RepID=A0A6B3LUF8_9BACT|nr:hypothetical protein [Pontibacter burrus]NEM97886.1 hypothetical protein [Pontibacter burrus]
MFLDPDDPEEEPPEDDLEELEPDEEPEAPPELLEVVDLFALVLPEVDEEDPDFDEPLF